MSLIPSAHLKTDPNLKKIMSDPPKYGIYLELRYGNNNCRFHETSPFSVLRRSSILISWGRRFLMNCGSFGQLTAILVHTSMFLKESFCFSFSAGD